MKHLKTISEIIDALGGVGRVAELTGQDHKETVYNWISRGKIPARAYPLIAEELAKRGFSADPALFGVLLRK